MPQVPATDDLREVEEAGSLWASRCIKDLFDEKDLEFFATRYQPFYAYLKKIEGLYQSTIGESEAFPGCQHGDTPNVCGNLRASCRGHYSVASNQDGSVECNCCDKREWKIE